MRHSNQRWFQQQFSFLRRQFLQDGDLPFGNVLSEENITQALTAIDACWKERIYSPLVTLWVFLGQAATKQRIDPRSISFKGAVQTLEAFQPVIAILGQHDSAFRMQLYQQLLDSITTHRVANRPDRFEPRRKKRRPKPYDRLMKPRAEAKRDMLFGFREN